MLASWRSCLEELPGESNDSMSQFRLKQWSVSLLMMLGCRLSRFCIFCGLVIAVAEQQKMTKSKSPYSSKFRVSLNETAVSNPLQKPHCWSC